MSFQDWEKKHKQVVTIYRSHLLAAVQVRWMDSQSRGPDGAYLCCTRQLRVRVIRAPGRWNFRSAA